MYLYGMPNNGEAPAACPAGWVQADYRNIGLTVVGNHFISMRTCITTTAARAPIYLRGTTDAVNVADCPLGWLQADYRLVDWTPGPAYPVKIRTCY